MPRFGPSIQQRAARTGTTPGSSAAGCAAHASEVLFSTVTSSSALEAATAIAPFLQSPHLYADLNSGLRPRANRRSIAPFATAERASWKWP